MGDRGSLVLVNGTPYAWQLTYVHSYQLTQWDASFPRTIAPFSSAAVTVQRSDSIFRDRAQDGGEATYTLLTNTPNPPAFQVQARADGGQGFRMQSWLSNLAAQNNALGSTVPIGWVVGGQTNWVLAGAGPVYVCNNPPEAWMQASLGLLGSRTLRQLCMPGSHDSGMGERNTGTAGAFDCNILTQNAIIAKQLTAGARYFDLRPVISGGQFYTGHYSLIEVGSTRTWQGANGQSFVAIVQQINDFTARCGELIILNISHELNTDLGNANYAAFTQAEWDRFLGMLQSSIRNLWIAPAGTGTSIDLSAQTLRTYIGSGRAAVLVMFAPSDGGKVSLSSQFAGKGFYMYRQLNAYDRYSNTNDLAAMNNDQLTKMRAQRTTPNNAFFLLSWTLTQNATQAATCFLGTASSILELASKANPTLFTAFFPACTSMCFPNVLYIDACANSVHVVLAMAVNNLMGAGKRVATQSVAHLVVTSARDEVEKKGKEVVRDVVGMTSTSVVGVEERIHTAADQVERTQAVVVKKVDGRRERIAELRGKVTEFIHKKR
ncbi:PLC-like phosphodiesterase [Auricularia subglabra TFB-10046 SS5]|nr:PLC-like phosphodiesterase [Auricularia subglabra TFB-10046 SS5]